MDRLARNDPRPPITLPAIDLTQWPQDPVACKGGTLREDHPIIAFADANPELVKDIDVRPRIPEFRRRINELLAANARVTVP
jgi:hypothetical protein